MKLRILLVVLVCMSLRSFAEVLPYGAIAPQVCGENTARTNERNRRLTKVCIAQIQGVAGLRYVVLHALNAMGEDLPLMVLPIIHQEPTKNVKPAKGTYQETVLLGSNQATKKEGDDYDYYLFGRASLRSKVLVEADRGQPPLLLATNISGTDPSGHPFNAELKAEERTEGAPGR